MPLPLQPPQQLQQQKQPAQQLQPPQTTQSMTPLTTPLPTALPTPLPTSPTTSLTTSLPTSLPTSLLTSLPTNIPTTIPTDIPTDIPIDQGQGERKGPRKYDMAIVDPSPPTKSDMTKTPQQRLSNYYSPLLTQAIPLLAVDGLLLTSCHCKDISDEMFQHHFHRLRLGRDNGMLECVGTIGYPPEMDLPGKAKMFIFKISEFLQS
eukprot:TRINITY_DN2370_c0_g1_i9.p1 TRINITY_DN2370_c0_g1~~TRINITY_DN2370_c0_g1_i9.p1  ORF type:complete len:206 (+),score=70.01 TRINITY_DN2370_c0_g1_i9:47-664(+)